VQSGLFKDPVRTAQSTLFNLVIKTSQLMMYKANVTVCSDICTKHSMQNERHEEFFNVKPWWYVKKPVGFKRLKG
jgi:hypothetical protein